jgi:UDP-N-acetylglucosamine:LPS N-acetylglucosamine transferase
MKICLACSAGGHLTEILQLKESYEKYDHFFLTFERENSKDLAKMERVYFVKDPSRNPLDAIINFFQSLYILLKERPDVIITTGAGVAVATCYLAKLFGKKTIFVESFCRVEKPSLSGRLVYPIADLFIVQWKQLLKFYPKAEYGGQIF